MSDALSAISTPSRVAEPDEGVSLQELQLAARNHGMLAEALRYDVTPIGLHYLLIHYDIPELDAAAFALSVGGAVHRPLTLSLDDLKSRPRVTQRVTMECAGNGRAYLQPRPVSQPWLVDAVGTAEWTGTPLAPVLREAGLAGDAVDVVFTGADHGVERGVEQDYQRSLSVAEALDGGAMLAYEMNGVPLPPQHGFPLRLVAPGWYGMAHVKWLRDITVSTAAFTGFQQASAYVLRQTPDEAGTPVTKMAPRALLAPPGFPDFMSRARVVRSGDNRLIGRAWSGHGPIVRVEVTTDAGRTWQEAALEAGDGTAWQRFELDWTAAPGRYSLGARGTDAAGQVQPAEPAWTRGGFANNMIQSIDVMVLPG
jgi:DMSO/TMAO reductase YedYZ molybdopterin-dependent catalytic subunit